MKRTISTKQMVTAAMFSALTFLATSVIKIQTPSFGYIHLGDAFVLLAGLFLGPVCGGFAAGIGSALSDLTGGYALWVPGTFLIKFLTAFVAASLFGLITRSSENRKKPLLFSVIAAGLTGEAVMILGYFLYNILVISISGNGVTAAALAGAASVSAAEIPFNIVQGGAGIVLCTLLAPVFSKISRGAAQRSAVRTPLKKRLSH